MKKYNCWSQDAHNERVMLFTDADLKTVLSFIANHCFAANPLYNGCYWMTACELPQYNIPYRSQGWMIYFVEV